MFLFPIPREVVCKHFGYVLGTANLRTNSLLVRTIFIMLCRSDKWRICFSEKLHGEPCLRACLNKIKVLIGKRFFLLLQEEFRQTLNPFQPNVAFHVETSHLFCPANQVNGFYMECNTGLKWVKDTLIHMWNWARMLIDKNSISKIGHF